jgi:Ca-activated chloride channel family protein
MSTTRNTSPGLRRPVYRGRAASAAVAAALLFSACGDSDTGSQSTGGSSSDTATEANRPLATSNNRVETSERAEISVGGGLTQEALEEDSSDEEMSEPERTVESDQAAVGEPTRIDRPSVTEPNEEPDAEFQDYGTNPFVDTIDDPFSTFAMDVDAASYTLARNWLLNGSLPDPAGVRVEEFVNHFDQDYQNPTHDTFAVYADGAPHPFVSDDTYVLRIGIAAREVSERERDDANLTIVVDVSGSMNADGKFDTVIESLEILVDELGPNDTISIISYSDDARVVLEPTDVRDLDEIDDAIGRLRTGGSTNAEAGLSLGFDVADEMFERNTNNKIILISDGVANVGNTTAGGIFERISESSRRGIDLIAIGVGISDYNDVLLEQLANQGDGFYAYVDSSSKAERIFATDLVAALQVVAEESKIQVEFNDNNVVEYRLLGFENREIADEDFRNDRVDAGEIGAGHTVTALYEIRLARGVDAGSGDEIGTVNVRWNEPGSRNADEISGVVTTDLLSSRYNDASDHFRLSATAATFAEVLRDSRYMRGVSFDELLDEAIEIANSLGNNSQADELVDLIDIARSLDARR